MASGAADYVGVVVRIQLSRNGEKSFIEAFHVVAVGKGVLHPA